MNYCPNCGTKINKEEVAGKEIEQNICSHCHKNIQELISNILQEELFIKECTNCKTMGPIDAKFCYNCGSKELLKKPRLKKKPRKKEEKHFNKKMIESNLRNILYINLSVVALTIVLGILGSSVQITIPQGLMVFYVIVFSLTLVVDVIYLIGIISKSQKTKRKTKRRVKLEEFFEEKEER
ncbi:MAG TPA: zinc ribbon domain-containing protein [Candidatus Bathyarchaeia archaeon]|nr:zinc ribbon domain-containing protein [Candidatus Bathyarchaeia archaeon]